MDEVTGFIVTYGVGKLLDEFLARLPTKLDALTRAKQEMIEAAARKVREALEAQARKNSDFETRLATAITEREATALFLRLLPEAAVANTHERMEMLACALAGLFQPDLTSEMRSRVSRALMQLEPSDVVELRKLDEAQRAPGVNPAPEMTPERELLVFAGLIERGGVYPNALGRAVLSTLREWAPRS